MARRKKHEEEHHGGAWKVAYADFVTAMMALFMVLWISAQEDEILIATSQYFQNPFNSPLDQSAGVMNSDSDGTGNRKGAESSSTNMIDMAFLHSLAREFYRMLNLDEADHENPIEVQVTNDGLRIRVFDRSEHPLFVEGRADLTAWGTFVMQNLAWMMDRHDLGIRIDAHTAPGYHYERPDYGAWELTLDRANETRRNLVHYALDEGKVERVTGFADTQPLADYPADSESNHRIEISLVVRKKS